MTAAASVMAGMAPAVALADEAAASSVVSAVQATAPRAERPKDGPVTVLRNGDLAVTQDQAKTVIPDSLTRAISVAPARPNAPIVGLRYAGALHKGDRHGGLLRGIAVYRDADKGVDIAVQPTKTGVRVMTVIRAASATTRFPFQVQLPRQSFSQPAGDGSVLLLQPTADRAVDIVLGEIAPPWAKDARGRDVPVHYEVSGTTLTLVVQHRGAAYPVVADPSLSRSWWGWTIKFNKRETELMAHASTVVGAIAALVPVPVISKLMMVVSGLVSAWSGIAATMRKCVALRKPRVGPLIPWYYSGGYCR